MTDTTHQNIREALALDFANRCGWDHATMHGFKVAHPDDIAKAMLAFLREVESAKQPQTGQPPSPETPPLENQDAAQVLESAESRNNGHVKHTSALSETHQSGQGDDCRAARAEQPDELSDAASECAHQLREAVMHLTDSWRKEGFEGKSILGEMEQVITRVQNALESPKREAVQPDGQPDDEVIAIARAISLARHGIQVFSPNDRSGFEEYWNRYKEYLPEARIICDIMAQVKGMKREIVGRKPPELFSEEEKKRILQKAEWLWEDLQKNELGGFSGINRPFFILSKFKEVIEEFGKRDVGLSWSKNDLDAITPKTDVEGGES